VEKRRLIEKIEELAQWNRQHGQLGIRRGETCEHVALRETAGAPLRAMPNDATKDRVLRVVEVAGVAVRLPLGGAVICDERGRDPGGFGSVAPLGMLVLAWSRPSPAGIPSVAAAPIGLGGVRSAPRLSLVSVGVKGAGDGRGFITPRSQGSEVSRMGPETCLRPSSGRGGPRFGLHPARGTAAPTSRSALLYLLWRRKRRTPGQP
jgi:hypothetical protein